MSAPAAALLLSLGIFCASPATASETRTYVISWFGQATYSQDDDCTGGVHQEVEYQFLENLAPLGYNADEIEEFRRKLLDGDLGELMAIMGTRGRLDGEPANPYTNPATVADPHLPALDGPHAFGFDLDGDPTDGFIDPFTGAGGVDNQMYRALGCARTFRGSLQSRPTYWDWAWGQTRNSQPAWLLTITLEGSGEASLRLERALEHIYSNSDGSATAHMTYRVDPDARSHNQFRAEVDDGMLRITEHKTLRILQNPLIAPELRLEQTHLRLTFQDDGTARGFVAGYQPWVPVYFGFAGLGIGGELQVVGDIPGLYYLLRQHADFDPDPATGINRSISVTYYFEAVPAFVVDASGQQGVLAKGGDEPPPSGEDHAGTR